MPIQRYSVNQHPIDVLPAWITCGAIAIPEIQRPFVWNAATVRDFIDSRNPDSHLKDGSPSTGKRILIDGQQRVTALLAALLVRQVVNKDDKQTRIAIAFHPSDNRFEVNHPR